MALYVITVTFRMTLPMSKSKNIVMDDEWVHPLGQNPAFSCQQLVMQLLSWIIEIWMQNDLVSDSSCNTVSL